MSAPDPSRPARQFVPIGLILSDLPGFGEYEYTYSRVRVLSWSIKVVAQQNGQGALAGGYATAPSYDLLSTVLRAPAPNTGGQDVSLVYVNTQPVEADGTVVQEVVGQHYGFRIGDNVYETNNSAHSLLAGQGTHLSSVLHTSGPDKAGGGETIVKRVNQQNLVSASVGPASNPTAPDSAPGQVAEVSLFKAASVPQGYDLPGVTMTQLSQTKRYRTRFPSTTKRYFSLSSRPFYFVADQLPVTNLELKTGLKYVSARRWMPLEWFSVAEGRSPMVLFGPYIAPLFAPTDATQPITVQLYYHVRLQFAGQV